MKIYMTKPHLILVSISIVLFLPKLSFACSTCLVGDPTLTALGAEKPYENRLRLSVDYLNRDEEIGVEGVDLKIIDENRLNLNLAWAPNRRWMFGLSLPWVDRELTKTTLEKESVSTPGDISINFKNYLQEHDSFQSHMYGLLGGVRFGTAEEQFNNGQVLDFDVQPGTGATTVNVGAWYAHFEFPWMMYTSTAYFVSGEGFQEFQAGDAWTFNAFGQYAKDYELAFQLGLEARWSEKDQFSSVEDPNSGGFIAFIAPAVIYTLQEDLLLNFIIKLPVVKELNGNHEEGTIITLGVTYDFDTH
ncbi:MAG: hypothetical protein DIZ80_00230 [endosymbiont of Galathealinum brachiosum]|uniref:Transporter n=1 Tax=endosymbiont of Galathealinum brachiosum TaxID=2200906 RepID=A0A370DM29_9GAMM|nr:MAG: hypothetical protein DIZ80_00230 [endosymbiont of Galathealinum brachiosum]